MTTTPLTDRQLADIRAELADARVSLMMFRSALGSTMGQITDTISQIGRGTAPLKAAQREAAAYRARWQSTVLEAKRQHAEVDRLRAELEQAWQQTAISHRPVDVDTLARLIHDADVFVNGGDYPAWDDLSTTPGLGQDDVRKAARYLLRRLNITPHATPAAAVPSA